MLVVICSASEHGFNKPFTSDSMGVPFERKQKEIAPWTPSLFFIVLILCGRSPCMSKRFEGNRICEEGIEEVRKS